MTNRQYIASSRKRDVRPTYQQHLRSAKEYVERFGKSDTSRRMLYIAELKRQYDRLPIKVRKRRSARFWLTLRRMNKSRDNRK